MAEESENVWRLIYTSHNLADPAEQDDELDSILRAARRRNPELGVTGALLASEDWFAQTLEGPEALVRTLYADIERDPRHDRVSLLKSGPVDRRMFGRWSMARVAEDAGPEITLVLNHEGIAEAGARGTLGSMADVLLYMRDVLMLARDD